MGRGVKGVMKVTLFNDCACSCGLSMRHVGLTEMLLILSKKTIFDLIMQGQVLDMIVQRNVTRFCTWSITLADQGL